MKWLKYKFRDHTYFPLEMWKVEPKYWQDKQFGIVQSQNPVVGVSWYEANAYCKWLSLHWHELPEADTLNSTDIGNSSFVFRLPLDDEWSIAAGGNRPEGRYPWDSPGQITRDESEILKRANCGAKIGHTTSVNKYGQGKSPHGVMDMSGNVWEWQANYYSQADGCLSLRGGSWNNYVSNALVVARGGNRPATRWNCYGFRVIANPSSA